MISARQLTKTFSRGGDTVEAVKGIDLEVAEGELVAFLGPNGAGKSTTLRMLTSLLEPTSGAATVAGFDVATQPAQVRSQIGYIGQGNGGGHSYRALDELHNQGRFYGLSKAEHTKRAKDLTEALDLTSIGNRTIQTMSGGQRRRLDVALGLMNHPPLLFLDEPTTGLDPHARANLWEHILKMREAFGMTMVLTTHYLDEADSMAERVIVIDHGEIIADDKPAALKRNHADDAITISTQHSEHGVNTIGTYASSTLNGLWPELEVRSSLSDDGLTITISTDHGAERLPQVITTLAGAGFAISSAEIKQATLDDVFLNLTGRSLREEVAA